MKYVHGDLIQMAIDGEFDVIIHGCNCQCTMGKGIARTVKDKLPEAFAADLQTTRGDKDKLGTITVALVERNGTKFYIVNGYTQLDWRGTGSKLDYDALRSVMRSVKEKFHGMRIGYPKIGAGLAGGNWGRISAIIDEEFKDEKHTVVFFKPS